MWFTSLIASAGGTILNEDGTKVTLPTGPTEKALEVMKRYSSSPVAPPNLSTAREDDARLGWESGDSAFMVNYSFVWPSTNGEPQSMSSKIGTTCSNPSARSSSRLRR